MNVPDRSILESFPVRRCPGALYYWARSLVLPERVQSLLLKLEQPKGEGVEILKRSLRRSVFRIRNGVPELPSIVVKGFPLDKIESRVKYRKYGLTEFSNYQQVASLGVPAPTCHAYFEVRSFGLVKANGVIIEDLSGWRSLAELARENPVKLPEILAKAIPLIAQLYESGVNHVDLSMNNLLESAAGTEVRLIDWQYCSFVTPRQPSQLVLQAAHFLQEAGLAAANPISSEWLVKLREATVLRLPTDALIEAVAGLQARGRVAASERLALALDPSTQQLLTGAH